MDFSGFNRSIFCYQHLLRSHSQCLLQSPGTAKGQWEVAPVLLPLQSCLTPSTNK